ncbi:MAG: 3-deoxy-manno-octulosonate cytidylyltransferase [Candidatus Aminicenantes bacterium]|nr:3-deoxy-manno-octulosonate cytidylyltransferase [Candidatus Aminicenantes bacterium]
MTSAAAVIPARFQATRFPGKPLALILGKPMLQWVYEGVRGSRVLDRVIIATDDRRIFEAAQGFGAEARMTSPSHISGTERVAEVAESLDEDLIVNVQGDEPLITAEAIDRLVSAIAGSGVLMASLMARVANLELLGDPHVVKVVTDESGKALYFSRSPLPYQASDFFYQHIGIYAYRRNYLLTLARMSPTRLELQEKLEQLRVLERGGGIKMVEIERPTLSVDTPQDIIRVESFLKKSQ